MSWTLIGTRGAAMPDLRDISQDAAAMAFLRLGSEDRKTKKNYRMIRMPNGQLIVLPSGILKTGMLRSQIRRASFSEDQFKEVL